MSKMSSLLALAALAALAGSGRSKRTPMESYEATKKKAAKDNQVFIIGHWPNIMKHLTGEAITVEAIYDAFLDMEEQSDIFSKVPDDQKDTAQREMVEEFERILNYWTEKGAFTSSFRETGEAPRYRLTHHGRGLVEGFKMAADTDGKLSFMIVKTLTEEEVNALHKEHSDAESQDSGNCQCGDPECPASILEGIMNGKKSKRSKSDSSNPLMEAFEEFLKR